MLVYQRVNGNTSYMFMKDFPARMGSHEKVVNGDPQLMTPLHRLHIMHMLHEFSLYHIILSYYIYY